jgi:putative transposase
VRVHDGAVDPAGRRILAPHYGYRAYPDASQGRALASAFGCARVVWNDCLRDRKEAHAAGLPYVKSAELSRLRITQAK